MSGELLDILQQGALRLRLSTVDFLELTSLDPLTYIENKIYPFTEQATLISKLYRVFPFC
jgi:hypothetical protein